ncbi:AbrB family transcriptional regulator [uncultured Jannaschia sp.]|uniref:AbrB family transcriptional regulator n=1 Tax=uncultured Jannaschia sp. TaxID=293347 RepID=UPI002628CFF7|nr:AbrB family transcriptional regulator [uncultured Jannaschia sp.]
MKEICMRAAGLLASAAMSTFGGWVAFQFGLPLAWLIGSALVCAGLSLSLGAPTVPRRLYRGGQVVVGVSVGLTVDASVFDRIGLHLYLVPLIAGISILLGRAMVPLLVRAGNIDRSTAFFALVPAGISEMADLAQTKGADTGVVTTLHAARVFLVVCILPVVIYHLGDPVLLAAGRPQGVWDLPLLLALAAGTASAVAGNWLGLPSAFIVGSMVGVAALSAVGALSASEPTPLLAAAQVILGLSLGARFRRATVRRLPRALTAGMAVLVLNGLVMAMVGLSLAAMFGLDPSTMLLSSATGGTAEMVLTAQAVAVDAALVALYQVMRGLGGNLMAGRIHAWTVTGPDCSRRNP